MTELDPIFPILQSRSRLEKDAWRKPICVWRKTLHTNALIEISLTFLSG